MFLSSGQLLSVILFVACAYWCVVVIRRFPEDLQEFREVPDRTRKGAVIFVWFITLIIAIFTVFIAVPLITSIIKATYDVFTIS